VTPEAQRIAIAEACGWKNVDAGSGRVWGVTTRHKGTPSEFDVCVDVPNYPFDLNAMHDAEKVFWDTGKAMEFTNQLVGIVCSARGFRWDKGTPDDHLMCLSHATAAQRAEAFLRTIGKWKGAK